MLSRPYVYLAAAGLIVAVGAAAATIGYPQLVIHSAPAKSARASDNPQADAAQQAFWTAFLAQRYDALPQVTEALTAAYVKNPNDPQLALLIGHAHLWRIAERERDPAPQARITDALVLANFYFSEALRLRQNDQRIAGWTASTQMALGSVHGDERARRRGYLMMKDSAHAYPEFNGFTLGYVMSRLPAGDPKLDEAVEAIWISLDRCLGHAVDRRHPDLSALGAGSAPAGPKRVCFNGPQVPHNVEGFALAFGDLLVKTGDAELATRVYLEAKRSATYGDWPFKALLEERAASAGARAAQFASETDASQQPQMIGTSAYACAICHAR